MSLLGGVLVADALISWESQGQFDVQVKAPDAIFILGDGASNPRYFKSVSVSANESYFAMEVRARAGAKLHVADVVRVSNPDTSSQPITLKAGMIANANYDEFKWNVRDGATVVATLDMTATSPSASFTLPASGTFEIDVDIDLAEGAGNNNANEPFTLWIEVS